MKSYLVKNVEVETIPFDWESKFWKNINTLHLEYNRIESKQKPKVELKLCYNSKSLIMFWKVQEKEVTCKHLNHFDRVYKDSCVEFFVNPFGSKGYFNFEINCIGKILSYYVTDWERDSQGTLKGFKRVNIEDIQNIEIETTIDLVELKNNKNEQWFMKVIIPFTTLINNYELTTLNFEKPWRANFYKCADDSPLPHWSSWNPVKELNFHQPDDFGEIRFESNLQFEKQK